MTTSQLRHLVGSGNGVEVFHAAYLLVVHETLELGVDAEHADAHTLDVEHAIAFDLALERCAREAIVGAEHGELGHVEETCHILHAEVKLVVAYGRGVDAHTVHQLYLHFALEEAVVG